MENQNYITILVHKPLLGTTNFVQITGKEMTSHIEDELWIVRERYKRLTKQITNKN
jgi:hypothetical protein